MGGSTDHLWQGASSYLEACGNNCQWVVIVYSKHINNMPWFQAKGLTNTSVGTIVRLLSNPTDKRRVKGRGGWITSAAFIKLLAITSSSIGNRIHQGHTKIKGHMGNMQTACDIFKTVDLACLHVQNSVTIVFQDGSLWVEY